MARHTSSMGDSILEGDVGGSPFIGQNKIFANEGGKRGLPCERIAGIGSVVDEEGDGCCGEGFRGRACVKEGRRCDLLVGEVRDAVTL